eukprot:GHVR01041743.1.p1 GENE.GHVR01041743.1~~GHVR01041743.1.p1  ORF type:complete len:109 (+),score=9.07 GHVR01041743.1:239-565(+)
MHARMHLGSFGENCSQLAKEHSETTKLGDKVTAYIPIGKELISQVATCVHRIQASTASLHKELSQPLSELSDKQLDVILKDTQKLFELRESLTGALHEVSKSVLQRGM